MHNKTKELLKKESKAILSKKLGVSRQTIYNLINGRHLPTLKLAKKISTVLGITLEDI